MAVCQCVEQFVDGDWLLQATVDPGLLAAVSLVIGPSRQCDDESALARWPLPHPACCLAPIHARHRDVEDHDLRMYSIHQSEGFGA